METIAEKGIAGGSIHLGSTKVFTLELPYYNRILTLETRRLNEGGSYPRVKADKVICKKCSNEIAVGSDIVSNLNNSKTKHYHLICAISVGLV